MKNLIVFISPEKKFTPECDILVRIQLENCARLGWKPEDVLLVTNFPFEYSGYKATLTKDEHFCGVRPRSIKTSIIKDLVDEGIIEDGHIYWNHDLDAFQVNVICEKGLELDNYDVGLTDYGWKSRLCMGSYFLKASSADIFALTKEPIFSNIEDEDVMADVLKSPDIARRCKMMNITYNIGQRKVAENIDKADKPLKVFHFHPNRAGKMDMFKPWMPRELVDIFAEYGYT